jgi:hypothetical protein
MGRIVPAGRAFYVAAKRQFGRGVSSRVGLWEDQQWKAGHKQEQKLFDM